MMKTFKDLEFREHKLVKKAVSATVDFPNGHWISVIGGPRGSGFYGDGIKLFEFRSSVTAAYSRGVSGWQSKDQITRHMRYLRGLPDID